MKKITVYTFLFFFLFHAGLSVCNSQNHSEISIDLKEVEMIPVLNRNLSYSRFQIIQPVNNQYVIIHRQPEGVSVMNRNGELQSQPGRSGRGPFEMQTPRYIHYTNQKVYIWDSNNLKFLVFDENIEPDVEFLGIRHAIDGFVVNNKGHIAVFQSPRVQDHFVHIYEVNESNRLTKRKDLGNLTDEGRTLFFRSNTGGILWNEDDLVWVEPSRTILNVYSTDHDKLLEIPFEDEYFEVGPSPYKPDGNFTSQTLSNIEEYFLSNSRIVSIRKLKEHILVEMEHFREEESIITYSIFDLDYNKVGRIELEEGGWTNYIRGVEENRLLYLAEDYETTGMTRQIRVREIIIE